MNSPKLKLKPRVLQIVVDCVILCILFFYYLFRVNARLFYQSLTPAFFWDADFMREYLTFPGGLLELFAQFCAQFFYFPITAALLFAILFVLVVWLGRKIWHASTQNNFWVNWLSILPLVPLLAIYQDYHNTLVILLGFLLALLLFVIVRPLVKQNIFLRLLLFPVIFILLYWIVAGPALLFALLILLEEIFTRKAWLVAAYIALFAFLLPILGSTSLFILAKENVFLLNTGILTQQSSPWAIYLLWGFFPFTFLCIHLCKNFFKNNAPGQMVKAGSALVVITLFIVVALQTFKASDKKMLLMDYYAQTAQWQKLLDLAQQGLSETSIVKFQINRALYFTNRLDESLFYFPFNKSKDCLFIDHNMRHLYPIQFSDLFYDLALINEAQHWAHEALSVEGDHPRILQRLAQVYLLKDEPAAAKKCLLMLQKTLWFRQWANAHLAMLNGSAPLTAALAQKKQCMPTEDFLFTPTTPELVLEELIAADPYNRMALEYWLACCLMEGKIGRMMKYVHYFSDLEYQYIPRHVEEAMMLYFMNADKKQVELPKIPLRKSTYEDFQKVMAIMQAGNGNKNAAFRDMQKYAYTYWFYATYVYKKDTGEGQNEKN